MEVREWKHSWKHSWKVEMKFFKPEDFEKVRTSPFSGDELLPLLSAELANAKLEREGVRVYGQKDDEEGCGWTMDEESGHPWATHHALLIGIEELPKKECEHEGYEAKTEFSNGVITSRVFACKHCGVKLKPKWVVAE